jgi:hypothetical protein
MPGDYVERFTGRGTASELVCEACATHNTPAAIEADDALRARVGGHSRLRFEGAPGVIELASSLAFESSGVAIDCPKLDDLAALGGDCRCRWIGVTPEGVVLEIDLDRSSVRELARVALFAPLELHVSANGRYAAVVQNHGVRGAIVELATGREITQLARDDNYTGDSRFPFAFVTKDERQLAIFAPEWNRLAAFDVATNEALTARPPLGVSDRHYLDYFHCGLHVSPGGTMIADNGWRSHPFGSVATWSLDRWLTDNVWESEDGRSRRESAWRETWDVPLCWIDEARFVVWGHGDSEALVDPAVDIFDARTGKLDTWFAGPERSQLVFDRVLFSLGAHDVTVWDVERGGRLLLAPPLAFARYHHGAKCFATLPADGRMTIARLRGLDADKSWATERVRTLAASIDDPATGLGVVGDALDDAGCTDEAMLAHCRTPGPHGSRCWVLDRLRRD